MEVRVSLVYKAITQDLDGLPNLGNSDFFDEPVSMFVIKKPNWHFPDPVAQSVEQRINASSPRNSNIPISPQITKQNGTTSQK
jgi:hypothetical protein